jgi:hypothetical protein
VQEKIHTHTEVQKGFESDLASFRRHSKKACFSFASSSSTNISEYHGGLQKYQNNFFTTVIYYTNTQLTKRYSTSNSCFPLISQECSTKPKLSSYLAVYTEIVRKNSTFEELLDCLHAKTPPLSALASAPLYSCLQHHHFSQ